ncbi:MULTISPECIES: orotate phosphoribosyltransferase [Acetoanaerobium]|jgi:orotate phosphoribosyltransferase|uniref:Orotate phosphoribosyltransferase n=1 Tax=Acetoanaerobium sticklandii (strain ATCC 12662 / DSM 519 / JCM 1433 / CCUG 9281 / NCIMB 10654 / HF) TaxID=499177 RepID=E3PUS8_ACESD|nr:orotate phosphoribosyltransferase [Acetoanaerobium sticklandii]CBH20408.1 Orotate phosphoribosyltransferase (OPRT) (OPRTase) [Acetoanaerobium sticklandii]
MIELLKQTDALLEGHFLLSSGKHSNRYVQCARILRYPDKAEAILKPVAEKLKEMKIDLLVGPAMGGILVAYELGRQLGIEAIFTERVDNIMALRRGFEVSEGMNIVICEDVVTTGKSSMEVKALLESMGAKVIAIASIIDRTNEELELPLISSLRVEIDTFDADDCPLCKQGTPVVKPGSRKMD